MAEKKPLIVEVKDGVMLIKANRPEEENGMNWEAYELMADAFEEAMAREDVRVIVMTGDEKHFFTGGRVKYGDPEDKRKYNIALKRREEVQARLDVPIIAAVSGDCRAGGMGFVADADFAIARKGARFGFTEAQNGTFPMVVIARTIDVMPKKKALKAYYSGELFSAEEALEMGYLNEIVEEKDLWPTVEKYIGYIKHFDKEVFRLGRKAYYEMANCSNRAERNAVAAAALPLLLEAVTVSKGDKSGN